MLLRPLRLTPEQESGPIEDRRANEHHDEEEYITGVRHWSDTTSNRKSMDTPAAIIQLEETKLETEKKWMRYRVQAALLEEELRSINEDLIQVYFQLEGQCRQGSGQRRDVPGKGDYELPADSTSPPASARSPPFMADYHPVPDAGPPNPNDSTKTRRCIIGRPIGMVLTRGSVPYNQWKCDKHRSQELFEGNMKINAGLPEREHAWKCA